MPYNYQLSIEAEIDIYKSYLWYENQRTGLGDRFLVNLETAERVITKNPIAFRIRYKKKVRGFAIKQFPYLILYIVEGKNINVISVFNTKQNPVTWKSKLE